MKAAGVAGVLTTPVTEATIDRFVASLPGWIRQVAEERSSPAFLFDLTPTAAAAMAAQGYQRGVYSSWSPKGGAGKTTLACNLAVLLGVLCQKKTLLVDANMNGGHVWLHMGLKTRGSNIYSLASTFSSRGHLGPEDLGQEVVPYGQYLDVLPGIKRVEIAGKPELVGGQGEAFVRALLELARRQYDFVIADLGSSPNTSVHLAALRGSDRVLLVATPDRTALVDARNTMETLVQSYGFRREHFWLVVNMYTDEAGLERKEIPTWMELVEMGLIPLDPSGRLIRATNTGVPFVMEYMQERSLDPQVEALLEGFVGVAMSIYPSLRPVWEDRRERVRRARKGTGTGGFLQRLLGEA
jgi:pilus assembly protein CpaE